MCSKRLLRTFNVIGDGVYVGERDGALSVLSSDGERHSYPIGILDGIAFHGSQSVSTDALALFCENGKRVSVFSRGGRHVCSVVGGNVGNVELRRCQWQRYFDSELRVSMARQFVLAKVINQRRNVVRFERNHRSDFLRSGISELRSFEESVMGVVTLSSLIEVEARAARTYWRCFGEMVRREGWWNGGRTKRPPLDAANALLSYLYTIFTNDVAGCLRSVGFDSQCGYLHEVRSGRDSLACDVVEEFRGSIVDPFVLRIINRKQLSVSRDFEVRGLQYFVTSDGKRKLFRLLDEYRCKIVRHSGIRDDVQVGELPLLQARLLSRHVRGEDSEYRPFILSLS